MMARCSEPSLSSNTAQLPELLSAEALSATQTTMRSVSRSSASEAFFATTCGAGQYKGVLEYLSRCGIR